MKSSVEKISPTRIKLSIDVEISELKPYIDSAYKTISERLNIPGFRKGHIPPAMVDQRVGRAGVIDEAITASLSPLYSQAIKDNEIHVIGRPTVEITSVKEDEGFSFTSEVDVRPELTLPNFSEITLTVDDVEATEEEINIQIEQLRTHFGTLTTVEKKIESGDFVAINLLAKINGEEIEGGTANDISYEVGTNQMVDGMDEAIIGLSAGEKTTFDTQLVGQKDDEKGTVTVEINAVKKRDLPELNEDFAKLASEFETLAELRADISQRVLKMKKVNQGTQARDLLVEKLTKDIQIPLPQNVIDDEVNAHLEGEGRLEDDKHRAEVTEEVTTSLTREILFDNIIQAEQVSVNENELTEYLFRASQRYGMTPEQFIKEVTDANQVTTMVAEVARAKALAGVLARVKVVTTSGKPVDLEDLAPKQGEVAGE
ncbi:MAG: trigger factor [Actinobacteria bacterium]|nr:trigger factor [Actinomycetota bacterium]